MASTTSWGPYSWKFLFTAALNHHFSTSPTKDADICLFFRALGPVLPCRYCVEYYDKIYKEMPLELDLEEAYRTNREYASLYWLYKVKDKVNEKLLKQEQQCYEKQLDEIFDRTDLSSEEQYSRAKEVEDRVLYTTPSPPFSEVVLEYMKTRSDCRKPINQQLLSCRHVDLPVWN